MGVSYSRNRWFVRWRRADGGWTTRAFATEDEARAFDREKAEEKANEETRYTLFELMIAYCRSNENLHRTTKERIFWLIDSGPAVHMRDKLAELLTRADLEQMREGFRARGDNANTINKAQAYIHAILAWGADQDLISHNPWRDYKRLKSRRYMVNPSMDVFRRIYERLNDDYKWVCKTAFFLALRPGNVELFSLEWHAFDWRRGTVMVRQGKSGMIKTVVPPRIYLDEAEARYIIDRRRGIKWVCHRDGKRITAFRQAWVRACKSAGVTMRPYDMRHLVASEMLAAGADLTAVAAQLGHASPSTTASFYAHLTRGGQQQAAALMPAIDTVTVTRHTPSHSSHAVTEKAPTN